MGNIETSVIIRTKNEEKWIGKVLDRLFEQTYKNFEIIVVDSGSIDKTLDIVKKYPIKLFQIKPEEFTYPYALNYGCDKSNASKYIVFLSAHSLPLSKDWLESGVENFSNNKVLGAYGMMQALPDGTIWEKLIFNSFLVKLRMAFNYKKEFYESGMGIMGFTHAIIRKDLWKKRKFNEEYALGGEDEEWSRYWFSRGYIAIKDAKFSVAHSHGLGLKDLIAQYKYWQSLNKPQKFKKLEFRK